MSGLNRFDAIIYINLEHRKDRRERIESELALVGAEKKKIHRIAAHYIPFNGHYGCALSHRDAMKLAIKKGWERVLILEDDVIFLVDEKMADIYIQAFLRQVKDWDVFFLSTFLHEYEPTPWAKIVKVTETQGSHAFAVQKHYYPVLLDLFERCCSLMENEPFFVQSDQNNHLLDAQWNTLQKKDLWYAGLGAIAKQEWSWSDIAYCYHRTIGEHGWE